MRYPVEDIDFYGHYMYMKIAADNFLLHITKGKVFPLLITAIIYETVQLCQFGNLYPLVVSNLQSKRVNRKMPRNFFHKENLFCDMLLRLRLDKFMAR